MLTEWDKQFERGASPAPPRGERHASAALLGALITRYMKGSQRRPTSAQFSLSVQVATVTQAALFKLLWPAFTSCLPLSQPAPLSHAVCFCCSALNPGCICYLASLPPSLRVQREHGTAGSEFSLPLSDTVLLCWERPRWKLFLFDGWCWSRRDVHS